MPRARSLLLCRVAVILAALVTAPLFAQTLQIGGPPSYQLIGDGINVRVTARITNARATTSAALRLELWAFARPFDINGASQSGYRMVTVNLAALAPGASVNVDQVAPYTSPPAGAWNVAFLLTEDNGTGTFVVRTGINFSEGFSVPLSFGTFAPIQLFGVPVALRTEQLMADSSQIYFVTPDTGRIYTINTTTGTSTILYTSPNAVQSPIQRIAQDNAFIYFLRNEGLGGTIQKVPKTGGAVTTVFASALNAVAPTPATQGLTIAQTGGRLYFNAFRDAPPPDNIIGIYGASISTQGGAATMYNFVAGAGRDTRTWMCTDYTNVYWVNLNQGASIRHMPLIGGIVTTDVATLTNGASYLSAPSHGPAGGSLFWIEGAAGNLALMRRKVGGQIVRVATMLSTSYALDGDRVYFESATTLRLSWASIDGGAETPVLPQNLNALIREIVSDGNSLFWLEEVVSTQRVGINKLALPVRSAPQIVQAPIAQNVAPGANVILTALSAGGGATYEWHYNGGVFRTTPAAAPEPGPQRAAAVLASSINSPTLVLTNVTAADMGFYSCVITNSAGTTETAAAILTVDTGGPSRLINLSTRGQVQAGAALTPGFVMKGTGGKQLLIRAVGPTLAVFGLAALSDTKMEVINQQTSTQAAANDDWSGTLTNTFSSLGAFALTASSKDAATLSTLPVNQGGYTVRITASGSATTGLALAEVYDADPITAAAKLANVSTLGFAGTGADALTPGFVIGGTAPKQLLIRAIGPGLAPFGVGGTLVDPKLSVIPLGLSITAASNDDWGGTAELKAAFAAAGAFSIPDTTKDAAVVVRLPPGGYSVVVSGANNTTGNVLVEVYDLDP